MAAAKDKPYFLSPADQAKKDFKDNPRLLERFENYWDQLQKYWIASNLSPIAASFMNYYDPSSTELIQTPNPVLAERKVVWSGFPRRLITSGLQQGKSRWWAYEEADKLLPIESKENPFGKDSRSFGSYSYISLSDILRQQDEYCEWFVHKNDSGTITRIDFTSEAPEFYQALWALGEQGQQAVLNLYRQYISPDVQLDDLHGKDQNGHDVYNLMNKWNGAKGAMHLQCPPNSLGAEVNLGAYASVPRFSAPANHIIEDGGELIACSLYGGTSRNSDPHIGEQVNLIARQHLKVTLKNPVALYQNSFDSSPLRKPDGKPLTKAEVNALVKCTRGRPELYEGLRHTIECPPEWGFVLGQMTIAGQPIKYGGQLAELMLIQLTGQACDINLRFDGSLTYLDTTMPQPPPETPEQTTKAASSHPMAMAMAVKSVAEVPPTQRHLLARRTRY